MIHFNWYHTPFRSSCLKTKPSTAGPNYILICTISPFPSCLKRTLYCETELHINLYHTPSAHPVSKQNPLAWDRAAHQFFLYPFCPSCFKTKASTVGQSYILNCTISPFPSCLEKNPLLEDRATYSIEI